MIQKTPQKPPKRSVPNTVTQYDPYIKELRSRALKVLVFFGSGVILGTIFYQHILSSFMKIFQLDGINLVLTSPYQFIDLSIKTGVLIGILFALPISVYFFLDFIRPALRPKEFRFLLKMMPFSVFLFVIGFCFGVWVVQFVIDLFSQTSSSFNVGNIWDLSEFLN